MSRMSHDYVNTVNQLFASWRLGTRGGEVWFDKKRLQEESRLALG